MVEKLLVIIALLLALYGCVALARQAILYILKPAFKGGFWILPVSGHCDNVEFLVRSAAENTRWHSCPAAGILLLDNGMDNETRIISENLCQKYPDIKLCFPQELAELLR